MREKFGEEFDQIAKVSTFAMLILCTLSEDKCGICYRRKSLLNLGRLGYKVLNFTLFATVLLRSSKCIKQLSQLSGVNDDSIRRMW